jgi:GH25 family lysozyme M1 (1,4-beta-N-acetylmuramidase)
MAYKYLGSDWSHWNGKPDCEKARNSGISFVFTKAGEVVVSNPNKPLFFDDQHDRNIRELKRVGIPCGSYYFFHPSAGASKQANHYAQIWFKNPPTLPPVIDVEVWDNMKPAEAGRQLLAFIQAIKDKIGIQPIIYSRNGVLVNNYGNPDFPVGTKFWIARYGATIGDLSPKIKPNVIIWQFTEKMKLPGLPNMDGNYWIQSDAKFAEFVQNNVQPLPEPLPEPFYKQGKVIVSVLNVRNTPDWQHNLIVGKLKKGDIVDISKIYNDRWAEIEPGKYAAIRGESGTYIERII